MRDACSAAGVGTFVPFWTRYADTLVRAKALLAAGELGDLRAVTVRWHNARPTNMPYTWRDDAALTNGVLADLGTHAYDTVRWLVGEDACDVTASTAVLGPAKPTLGDIDLGEAFAIGRGAAPADAPAKQGTACDFASVDLMFPSGVHAAMLVSNAAGVRRGLAADFELHGTDASLAVDRLNGRLTLLRGDEREPTVEDVSDIRVNRFDLYVVPALHAHAAGEAVDVPDLDAGLASQVFVDAAATAAARGTRVALSEFA
jgi:predicted dehydrogenase